MKKSRKKFLAGVLVLFASVLLISTSSFAAGPYVPYLNYSASFDWNKTAPNQLNIFNTDIYGVTYLDGSYITSGDLILGAYITISSLYNTATYNKHFDNGSGGGVTFQISDGTYTFLTATLTKMDVILGANGAAPTANSNITFSDFNLTNIVYGTGFSSRYIDELKTVVGTSGAMGLSANFSFTRTDGTVPYYDFKATTGYSTGSIQGIVSAPEPVSSLLFVTGAVTLGFRRYFKRKK